MKIALLVGHSKNAQGASNKHYPHLTEYSLNLPIAKQIAGILIEAGHDAQLITDPHLRNKAHSVNNMKPDIQVSLHMNAFRGYNSGAAGCEVLIEKDDSKSRVLAEILLEKFTNLVSINRGIKERSRHHRGGFILCSTNADIRVLCEPLFIDGKEGEKMLEEDNLHVLASLYADGILEYIEGVIK